MTRVQLAHPNDAEVGQVRTAVRVPLREDRELRQMVAAFECQRDQPLADHGQGQTRVMQMKGRLGQDGFAAQERLRQALRHLDGPFVVAVSPVRERDQESGVRYALHDREKPFRDERSLGPRTVPASRMNAWFEALAFAFSS